MFVSAVSGWEIATKVRLGKLQWPETAGTVSVYVLDQGFQQLPMSLSHAELAGELPMSFRDPFDRMLIAQARLEDLWLVSNEMVFDAALVKRYW